MRLEKNLIDLLITIHNALFLLRQMQFPVYKHGIRVRYRGLNILNAQIIDPKNGAGDSNEIYQISKGREYQLLVFKIPRFVFGERAGTGYDLEVVSF